MLLAFPSGRLETTAARALIAVAYLDALLVQLPYFFLSGDISGTDHAPGQRVGLIDDPDSAQVFATVAQLVAVALIFWLARAAVPASARSPRRRSGGRWRRCCGPASR